jgi:RNA polymerase sigma factor (sigma-70 family)
MTHDPTQTTKPERPGQPPEHPGQDADPSPLRVTLPESPPGPRDDHLLLGLQANDPNALRQLMDRYDRLVRYAIFQAARSACHKDPNFLDSLASDVWLALVQRARRDGTEFTQNMQSYLIQVARNKCADHWRRESRRSDEKSSSASSEEQNYAIDPAPEPADVISAFEQTSRIRELLKTLPENERNLLQEMDLLTSGRWKEASRRLNSPESTLRSQWSALVAKLARLVEGSSDK